MTWQQVLTLTCGVAASIFSAAYLVHERLDRMNERTNFLYTEISRIDRDTRDLNARLTVEVILQKCQLNPGMCGDGN